MTARIVFQVSFLSFIAATAIGASAAQQSRAAGTIKPTIVLVHGAFEDGTAWQHVVAILQRNQYDVVAVQAPLTSLTADVQATKRVIDAQTGAVVLVGHSWGGAVITDAAAGDGRVKALVYIAAFAPDTNEVVTAYNEKYPTSLGSALRTDKAGYVSVDPAKFHELFAKDIPAAQARVTAATQKPTLGGAFGDSVCQCRMEIHTGLVPDHARRSGHRSEPAAILRRAHESQDDGDQIQSRGHRVAPGGSRKTHRSSAVVHET